MSEVRIGVIGAAGRGAMARHWHDPGGRSVGVGAADPSEAALEWYREHVNGKGFTTREARALIDRTDVDAIAVMSPDDTHERYVCDAFEAGKHVFSEKPMAITTEGCDRMLRAWVASKKKFMIGFNMRYANLFRVMKEAIDSGAIGEVKAVWVRHFVGHGGDWLPRLARGVAPVDRTASSKGVARHRHDSLADRALHRTCRSLRGAGLLRRRKAERPALFGLR